MTNVNIVYFSDQILTAKFMKKFIHIARCMKPKLTEEACDCIAEEYSRLRSDEEVASDVARVKFFCLFFFFFKYLFN